VTREQLDKLTKALEKQVLAGDVAAAAKAREGAMRNMRVQ